MQLIENMKTEIGKLILNRSFTKRVAMKVMPDFASMQSIAILYDASNKQDDTATRMRRHMPHTYQRCEVVFANGGAQTMSCGTKE